VTFLCILLQTDCTILKVTTLTTMVYVITEKNLHIIGGEKKGVAAITLYNFRVLSGENFGNHWSRLTSYMLYQIPCQGQIK
jgi:hypothetical protein